MVGGEAPVLLEQGGVAGFQNLTNIDHDPDAPVRGWLVEQFDSLLVIPPGSPQQRCGLLALVLYYRNPAAFIQESFDLALDFPPRTLLLVYLIGCCIALHGDSP
jgi:hypothetical protein